MLIHCNATVSITRLVDNSGEKTMQSIKTGYSVYLQPRGEKVVVGLDSQSAYKEYILMTEGDFEILIGDQIINGSESYIVSGGQTFTDLTGTHGQYILMKEYD